MTNPENDLKGYCHCEVVPGVKCAPCRAADEIVLLRNQLRSLGWESHGDRLTKLPDEPGAERLKTAGNPYVTEYCMKHGHWYHWPETQNPKCPKCSSAERTKADETESHI